MTGEKEERRVVRAEEILGKIERGEPVEYEDVVVEGDLDLSKLNRNYSAIPNRPHDADFGYEGMPTNNLR